MCDIGKLKMHFRRCDSQDVAVLINVKGETLEICHKCWKKLADTDISWGDEGVTEGILEEEQTEIKEPILGIDKDEKAEIITEEHIKEHDEVYRALARGGKKKTI